MSQISYWANQFVFATSNAVTVSTTPTLTFFPMDFHESISMGTLNFAYQHPNTNGTVTVRFGLYSLNGSTLSLANWYSRTLTEAGGNNQWVSMSATSAAQNITPGTWWWGVLVSLSTSIPFNMFGASLKAGNAFPGFFGGAMTASTSTLPSSVATSNLDVTADSTEFNVPMIMLSA